MADFKNGVPVVPFFNDTVEVHSHTDVDSMPTVNTETNVNKIPDIKVSEQPDVEGHVNADVKSMPEVTAKIDSSSDAPVNVEGHENVDVKSMPKVETDANVTAVPDIGIKSVPTVDVKSSTENPVHNVLDRVPYLKTNIDSIPTLDVQSTTEKPIHLIIDNASDIKGEKGDKGDKGDSPAFGIADANTTGNAFYRFFNAAANSGSIDSLSFNFRMRFEQLTIEEHEFTNVDIGAFGQAYRDSSGSALFNTNGVVIVPAIVTITESDGTVIPYVIYAKVTANISASTADTFLAINLKTFTSTTDVTRTGTVEVYGTFEGIA